jgi:hypothetical protein
VLPFVSRLSLKFEQNSVKLRSVARRPSLVAGEKLGGDPMSAL